MRGLCLAMLAAVACGAPHAPVAVAQQAPATTIRTAGYSDDQVKAAFLYNFGTYVQWPSSGGASEPITFAILGAPSIARELERFLPGRTIQGRAVRVRRLRTIDDLENDHVLFIGADENSRLAQLIEAVEQRPTLIVTDAPDGLVEGAMINFQLIEQRVRFEIALRPAQDAGLMLSSRLLSAALRVETTRCSPECREVAAQPMLHAGRKAALQNDQASLT